MSVILRVVLFSISLLTMIWIIKKVRQNNLQPNDAMNWVVFYVFVFLCSIFPVILINISKMLGVDSPANFVFLVIIFFLLINVFVLNIRISRLENKFSSYVKNEAVRKAESFDCAEEDR